MDPVRYDYTIQYNRRSGSHTYRPLVDVLVGGPTTSRKFKALVDSGTEITVMDDSIAELLGISSEGCATGRLSGLDEWKEGFLAPVSLKIEGFDHVFNFTVLFTEDLNKNFDIILGQCDFFRNFNVIFKKVENAFYLDLVQ